MTLLVPDAVNDFSREYCLDLYGFASIDDARVEIDYWQHHYNRVWPRGSLRKKTARCVRQKSGLICLISLINSCSNSGVRSTDLYIE